MRILALIALLAALVTTAPLQASNAESEIRAVLNTQLEAWNRGDIPALVNTYAPDCIFVGKQVAHGRAQLLARYQKAYPSREAMGHLTFSAIEIHLLDDNVAVVTGAWHLARSGAGVSNIGGLFSLVVQHRAKDWKIALDHTS